MCRCFGTGADHDQTHRADLFDRLLTRIDQQAT